MSLTVNNLSYSYGTNKILNSITTTFNSGEVSIIAGPNGAGKTTLLKTIMSQLKPDSGTILLNSESIHQMKSIDRAKILGYVSQNSLYNFDYTVYEIVEMGRYAYKTLKDKSRDRECIDRALELTNTTTFINRKISSLSGGELQRVILARALTIEPQFLILDEPASNLDISHNIEIMDLIHSLTKSLNMTTVIVLHDLNSMLHYGDNILFLGEDRTYLSGSIEELLVPETIKKIYHIDTQIIKDRNGKRHLITI